MLTLAVEVPKCRGNAVGRVGTYHGRSQARHGTKIAKSNGLVECGHAWAAHASVDKLNKIRIVLMAYCKCGAASVSCERWQGCGNWNRELPQSVGKSFGAGENDVSRRICDGHRRGSERSSASLCAELRHRGQVVVKEVVREHVGSDIDAAVGNEKVNGINGRDDGAIEELDVDTGAGRHKGRERSTGGNLWIQSRQGRGGKCESFWGWEAGVV